MERTDRQTDGQAERAGRQRTDVRTDRRTDERRTDCLTDGKAANGQPTDAFDDGETDGNGRAWSRYAGGGRGYETRPHEQQKPGVSFISRFYLRLKSRRLSEQRQIHARG